jgi:hypothetical protein
VDRLSLVVPAVAAAAAMLMAMGMTTVTVLRLRMAIRKGSHLAVNGPSTLKMPTGLMERLFLHPVCQHTLAFHPTVRPTDTNLATRSPPSPKKAHPKC